LATSSNLIFSLTGFLLKNPAHENLSAHKKTTRKVGSKKEMEEFSALIT